MIAENTATSSSTYYTNSDGLNFISNFVIRDDMFKPFTSTSRTNLNRYFMSKYYDVDPWICIDLGVTRIVNAVQISQQSTTAISGNNLVLAFRKTDDIVGGLSPSAATRAPKLKKRECRNYPSLSP